MDVGACAVVHLDDAWRMLKVVKKSHKVVVYEDVKTLKKYNGRIGLHDNLVYLKGGALVDEEACGKMCTRYSTRPSYARVESRRLSNHEVFVIRQAEDPTHAKMWALPLFCARINTTNPGSSTRTFSGNSLSAMRREFETIVANRRLLSTSS